MRFSGVVVNVLALGTRGEFQVSLPGHVTILLGSNLGQIVYSRCLAAKSSQLQETGVQRESL